MNRNVESHFALNPTRIDIPRSRFDRGQEIKFTGNVGEIIPFYVDEVLPGDTHKIRTSKVVRMQPLVSTPMDNIYCDTYYFFVPNRLVWEHWKEFMGENTSSAWLPTTTYTVPQITSPSSTGWNIGTIADYMGIPTGKTDLSVSALPFRAYAKVIDDWFRDENLQNPLVIPMNETTVAGVNTGTFVTDVAKGGLPYVAAKYHDYFTSALPAPQKGPDVPLPVAQGSVTSLPVFGNEYNLGLTNGSTAKLGLYFTTASDLAFGGAAYGVKSPARTGGSGSDGDIASNQGIGVVTKTMAGSHPEYTGLIADASALSLSVGTINQLRLAFQIQKFYEQKARGGSRYIETLKSFFGVTSPDYRLQRSEYLGGVRVPIQFNQVIQTSETATTPQGNVAAYSLTSDTHKDLTKSFTEHGFIIGVMVLRYDHTYQQGIERMWSRKDIFDYYFPVFANIGEQAILNKEIYAQGSSVVDTDGNVIDEQVFGYQEAWADYRYKPSRVAGEMRSSATTPLDMWHFADKYNSLPYLSDTWIREDKSNVDRALAVQSSTANQFFADVYVQNTTTRPMPVYSVPGLIDHH